MEDSESGYSCLAQNPMDREKFCSSSQVIDDADNGIMLWDVNPKSWEDGDADFGKRGQANKRQRTDIASISPIAVMKCQNGVQSMAWAAQSTLIAGCVDHQLKVFDIEKLQAQASIFTNHKVVTAIDSNFSNQNSLVLGAHEDGVVKLYDLRQAQAKQTKTFECHQRYISQVKINPCAENVFITCALDGQLKLWDMRNEQAPLSVLKRAASA